jgi:ZIP family zinc transporter
MPENFWIALLLTAFAGLSTTLGSVLGLMVRKPRAKFLGFTLGFSGGVMILVSFVELLPGSFDALGGGKAGFLWGHVAFFAGMISYFLIDLLVPHEYVGQHDHPAGPDHENLKRTGLLIALGLGIHNFPEGMATFAGALQDVDLGIAIAVAIAIHNIPEGLAVSAPVYAATGSRAKAFGWSFVSGLTEPAGALVAGLILLPFLTPAVMGGTLAAVAGIMVAISVDEIVPAAKSFGSEHLPIVGVVVGMIVMALSLWMLA